MRITKCSNCDGTDFVTPAATTPANGTFGPNLLPKIPSGRFVVVVCKDCGLTQFFARQVDVRAMSGSDWTRVAEPAPTLGLGSE